MVFSRIPPTGSGSVGQQTFVEMIESDYRRLKPLLILAIDKKGLRRLAVLSMLIVYGAVSGGLFLFPGSREMHWTARWFLWSKNYKAKVPARPDSTNGTLRHIEWDGWGFPGAGDTVVYLVFDPNDSLLTAARSHSPGKFGGIPCDVPSVRRLESQYTSFCFIPTPIGPTAIRTEKPQ